MDVSQEDKAMIEEHRMFRPGQIIMCDANGNDTRQYFKSEDRFNDVKQDILKHYTPILKRCRYWQLSIEISKGGRLHAHANLELPEDVYGVMDHVGRLGNAGYMVKCDSIEEDKLNYRIEYVRKDRGNPHHIYMHGPKSNNPL